MPVPPPAAGRLQWLRAELRVPTAWRRSLFSNRRWRREALARRVATAARPGPTLLPPTGRPARTPHSEIDATLRTLPRPARNADRLVIKMPSNDSPARASRMTSRAAEGSTQGDGRRPAGRLVRQQHAFGERLERDGAAGVSQLPGADNGRRIGVGAELIRCTGRAMLGVLQVADKVVVLERRDDEKRRVERDACQSQERPIVTSRSDHSSSHDSAVAV